MKNNWTVWVIVLGVVAVILFVFNYQAKKDMVPVNHILPDESVSQSTAIEYEFVDQAVEEGLPATPAGETTASVPSTGASSMAGVATKGKTAIPAGAKATASQPDLSKGKFTIQVTAAKNKAGVEAELKKLLQQGHPAYLVTKDLGEKGIWHRIYIGSFGTKAQADEYLVKVKGTYKSAFVVSLKN